MAAAERSVPARVWSGTGLLVVGRHWSALCHAVALAVLARALPGAEFGRYTFWLATFALVDALVDFGTGTAAVERTADAPERLPDVLWTGRRIRARFALLALALVASGVFVFGESEPWMIVGASLYVLARPLELSSVVFRNAIRWGVPVVLRASGATLRLALLLGLVVADVETAGPYLVMVALGTVAIDCGLFVAARMRLARPTLPRRGAPDLFAVAAPLGVAAVCQQAYFHVDNAFVRGMLGAEEVGRYNAAVRILAFLLLVAALATTTALPWFVRRHRAGELADAVARLGQPLAIGAGLGLGLLAPFADEVLALVFGREFSVAATALRWLLAAAGAVYFGATLLTAVVATGRTRAVLGISLAALAFNIAANAWAVPAHGIEGAAFTTFLTELIVAVGALVALARVGVRPLAVRPLVWLAGPALAAATFAVATALGA